MAASEAQKRASSKYDKKTYKMYAVKLRIIEDADLIELLEKDTFKKISIKAYRK